MTTKHILLFLLLCCSVKYHNMYGWLETGGFFADTAPTDIVLRTASYSQLIALGNPNSNALDTIAGLYVQNNNLGVRRLPESNVSLGVNGPCIFENGIHEFKNAVFENTVTLDGSRLSFLNSAGSRSVYIDTRDSRIASESIVAKRVFTPKRLLSNVRINSIVPSTFINQDTPDGPPIETLDLTIDGMYSDQFADDIVFVTSSISYLVHKVVVGSGEMTLTVSNYSTFIEPRTIEFSNGDFIDMEILEDLTPTGGASSAEKVYYRFIVDQYTFIDSPKGASEVQSGGELEIKCYFQNPAHVMREKLELGSLHVFAQTTSAVLNSPELVLQLLEYQETLHSNGQVLFTMKFKSLDWAIDLSTTELAQLVAEGGLVMAPLTFLKGPIGYDDYAVVGFTVNEITNRLSYHLTGTRLSSLIGPYYGQNGLQELICYGLESVKLGNRNIKNVKSAYKPYGTDSVVIDTYAVDDAVFNVFRQEVKWVFKGIPLCVVGASQLSAEMYEFEFTTPFDSYLVDVDTYAGGHIYWFDNDKPSAYILGCNKFSKVDSGHYVGVFTVLNEFTLNPSMFVELNRFVYVVPFKITDHVRIADSTHNVFIPEKLGISTYLQREVLTVGGDISAKNDIVIYNGLDDRDLRNRCKINFNDECVFNINDQLLLTSSNAIVQSSLETKGTLTATDFMQYSDRRLKYDIKATCPLDDLHRVMSIDVKDFKLLANGKQNKGVIAQEIKNVFPEAVTTVVDTLPGFFNQVAVVDKERGKLRLHQGVKDIRDVKVGDMLRVASLNNNKQLHVDVQVYGVERSPVDENDDVICIEIGNTAASSLDTYVKVVGVVDEVMLVNYEILYMSAINAIKQLKTELDDLRLQTTI